MNERSPFHQYMPDKDPSGSTESCVGGGAGAALGINARPLIVRPITSM